MRSKTVSICARVAAVCAAVSCWPPCIAHAETFAWTQYGPSGLEARAVTDAAACPDALIDGRTVAMAVRAAPGESYPVTTCAVPVPRAVRSLKIGGAALGLPVRNPKRIAVLGDTGCRLKDQYLQGCNDPALWPFQRIAARIAQEKPDLILHMGDYHYRETPCPATVDACAGSPYGDTWAAWRADLFAVAAPLLTAAPLVLVRGNHEDCQRAGKGWSRLFAPEPFDTAKGCNRSSAPYTVKLPRVTLAVLDVTAAQEERVDTGSVARFAAQYTALDTIPGRVWLLQHRPIWGAGGFVAGLPFGDNKTLAAAARTTMPKRVQMMLTGHHHLFQALSYLDDLPAQVTVGHGGDYLNAGKSSDLAGLTINGVTVHAGLNDMGQFGYAMIEPAARSFGGNWVVSNINIDGRVTHRCGLKNRKIACIKG